MASDRSVIRETSKSRPPSKTNGSKSDTAPPRHRAQLNGFSEITIPLGGRGPSPGDYKQADYGKVILPLTVLPPAGLRARENQGEKSWRNTRS